MQEADTTPSKTCPDESSRGKAESKRPGEFELIERIRASLRGGAAGAAIVRGIGDDCAITTVRTGYQLLSTIDVLVENVHFRRSYITPEQLGHKAMAVNLSDIAAMGGIPRHALVSLCITDDIDQAYIDELYRGMRRLASASGTSIVGGNISASREGLVINVAILGEVEEGKALLRSGAGPGDSLFITGELGLSAAGMELLNKGYGGQGQKAESRRTKTEPGHEAVRKHLAPTPRLKEGRRLLEWGGATAAIDLSDGLASDLRHICKESKVGAIIYGESLPIATAVLKLKDALANTPLHYALFGGEDYELLVAIEKDRANELKSIWERGLAPIIEVGMITEKKKGIRLVDEEGRAVELPLGGWDHLGAPRGPI